MDSLAPKYTLVLFHYHLCSILRASLNTYTTYTWKTTHLVKIWHSDLPHNLGLFPIIRRVGLNHVANFSSGPRPCHLGLPSPILWPNHRLHLVQRFSVSRPTPHTPFLKPSFIGTYVIHESVKLGIEPSPHLHS
jgi:hypothetical protein